MRLFVQYIKKFVFFFVYNKVAKLFTFSLFCVKIKDSLVLCGFYLQKRMAERKQNNANYRIA